MNRRRFLQAGAAALALSPLSSVPARAHSEPKTFLLIHGAWHNSLTWSRVVGPLTSAGHRVLAIDLPGHGVNARFPKAYFGADREALKTERSPLAELTLEDAADAVLAVARPLGRCILVGHSMGGHVISRVAEREPDLVERLVYLAAMMPVDRPSFADYTSLPQAHTALGSRWGIGDPQVLGASRIDPRSHNRSYLETLHRAFYGDVDFATFQAFGNGLTPDQPLHYFLDSPGVTRDRWGAVPRTFLITLRDDALPSALQELFIAEADRLTPSNRTRVVRLDTSHSPFASQPELLARVLGEQSS